jgi:hypothetical protein
MEFQLHKQPMKSYSKLMFHIIQKQIKDKNDEENLNPKGKVMIEFLPHATQASRHL